MQEKKIHPAAAKREARVYKVTSGKRHTTRTGGQPERAAAGVPGPINGTRQEN